MIPVGKIPRHIGIIMDGNGRWAQSRGLSRIEGHRQGARRTKDIIKAAINAGVKVLTLYAFSIENWNRPILEVNTLMGLFTHYLQVEIGELVRDHSIVFRVIGDRERLPGKIRDLISGIEVSTAGNEGMTLVPAVSYGGRDEILRAVKKIVKDGVSADNIDEKLFEGLLDTAGLPPVDLVIRTSGEERLSNFLLWQSAYAEFYFADTLWPDFTNDEFLSAIGDFQKRDRRFGEIERGGKI
ncbi:ditrans,polycis-undecaprenyl-diphosphate synthase [bacterium BMS3Abin07]|nr:ditrans,polycis-undecaprenyl-diphosphate synthase [bacterium BMS3Abin07]GBE32564.1 ditrans,polycis-undecaprenyl-diphosphate synthase [bacterium BMS3Bbin05]